jgi:hypothetical protein
MQRRDNNKQPRWEGEEMTDVFKLIEDHGLTLHGDIEHFAELVRTEKQEPYGYFRYDIKLDAWVQNKESTQGIAFYTTPPKREWVDLTEEDIYQVIEENIPPQLNTLFDMAKWVSGVVEAKLKEKNT